MTRKKYLQQFNLGDDVDDGSPEYALRKATTAMYYGRWVEATAWSAMAQARQVLLNAQKFEDADAAV